MSAVKFTEKLLDGVEVEWKALGELGEFVRGGNFQKKHFSDTGIGCIHYGQIYTYYSLCAHQTKTFIPKDLGAKCKKAQSGNLVIATTSENDEDVCKAVAWLGCEDIAVSSDACIYKHNLNPKYVSYYFQSEQFQTQKREYITGAKVRRVNASNLEKIIIPIPCTDNPKKSLEIQEEIVRILDTFNELTTELTTELTARQKQYNYYRDRLLTFEEGKVEWKTLGEVAQFRRGTAITKKQTTEGDIPVIANGPRPTYYHGENNREGEIIVIARSGAYAGYVSFWSQPIFLTDAFSVHPNANILILKYVYYFLQNKQDHIHAMKKGAGVPHVRVKEFESYKIPLPFPNDTEKSLAEQNRIVSILDNFDAITNSITEGLPREIELRKKQYEYYRDLLFSFPKEEVEV